MDSFTTYADGFLFTCERSISKRDYMLVADALGAAGPEKVSEGGMVFIEDERGYKSMRHETSIGPTAISRWRFVSWPWISDSTPGEWRNSNAVLWPQGTRSYTFLRASDGAPRWTIAELQQIAQVFEANGMRVENMPTDESLDSQLTNPH